MLSSGFDPLTFRSLSGNLINSAIDLTFRTTSKLVYVFKRNYFNKLRTMKGVF